MGRLLSRVLGLAPEVLGPVLLMASFAFSTAGAYILSRTLADTMFLHRAGADQLPNMYLISAGVVAIIALAYARLTAHRRLFPTLATTMMTFAGGTLVCLFFAHGSGETLLLVYGLYLLTEIRGSLGSIQFSILANDLFNNTDPKRAFAFIGTGATLAGVLFAEAGSMIIRVFDDLDMIFYLIALLDVLALVPLWWVRSMESRHKHKPHKKALTRGVKPKLKQCLTNHYARQIAILMALSVAVGLLIEFLWKSAVGGFFAQNETGMAQFFGHYYSVVGLLTLVVQIVFAGRFLKRFGVSAGLLLMPLAVMGAGLAVVVTASTVALALWSTTAGKGCDILKRTINQPALQLLYWPLPSAMRRAMISVVGGVVKPLAEALTAGLLMWAVWFLDLRQMALLVLSLTALWILAAWRARKLYVDELASSMQDHRLHHRAVGFSNDRASAHQLQLALASDDQAVVRHALELLEAFPGRDWSNSLAPLLSSSDPVILELALKRVGENKLMMVADLVFDLTMHANRTVRAQAIDTYCQLVGAEAVPRVEPLLASDDVYLRRSALIGLLKYGTQPPSPACLASLRLLLTERRATARLAGAQVLTAARCPDFDAELAKLIADPNPLVACEAVRAAGTWEQAAWIDPLIQALKRPEVAATAVQALAHYGEPIVSELSRRFHLGRFGSALRREVPRVLRKIPTRASLKVIIQNLDHLHEEVRYEMLLSAHRLVVFHHVPLGSADRQRLHDVAHREVRQYCAHLVHLDDLGPSAEGSLIKEALLDRAERTAQRLLLLAAMEQRDAHILDEARMCLQSRSPRVQAIARELLQNTLKGTFRNDLLTIVSTQSLADKTQWADARFVFDRLSPEARLRDLLASPDYWVTTAALVHVRAMKYQSLTNDVHLLLDDPSYLVSETSLITLEVLQDSANFERLLTDLSHNPSHPLRKLAGVRLIQRRAHHWHNHSPLDSLSR